jgi:hypothetical protein
MLGRGGAWNRYDRARNLSDVRVYVYRTAQLNGEYLDDI